MSERPNPLFSAPGSRLFFSRRSEPSTRMLLAEVSGLPAESSTLDTFESIGVRSNAS